MSPPSVYEVYVEQFGRDFKNFLKSRSDELALDGVMVLTLIGREKNGEITSYEVLSMVLNEMVQEVNMINICLIINHYKSLVKQFKIVRTYK